MRRGNWLDDDFPKRGWVRIATRTVAAQQCGMCCTSVCRTIYHLEHAGPPYRRIEAGKDCAEMLTDGDMRTRAEREADAMAAEKARQEADYEAEREREADYFRRAEATPWDFASFRDVGWRETAKGFSRKLADGNVTLFRRGGGWKVAICLDGAEPAFSDRVYSSSGEAERVAWDWLPRVREHPQPATNKPHPPRPATDKPATQFSPYFGKVSSVNPMDDDFWAECGMKAHKVFMGM